MGGIRDQIYDGVHGLLVDPTDPVAFGEAVSRLLRDDQLALEVGHAARRRVRTSYLAPHFLAGTWSSRCASVLLVTVPSSAMRRSVIPECSCPVLDLAGGVLDAAQVGERVQHVCSDSSGDSSRVFRTSSASSGSS